MRFLLDGTWRRHGPIVLAGSPLRSFRLTEAGERVAAEIEAGGDVARSRLVDRLLDAGAIHPDVAAMPTRSPARFARSDVTVVTPQLGGALAGDGRITVDDGSQPPLPGADVRLPDNRGPAAARNAARDLVTTPLVAFLDADVDDLDELGGGCWIGPLLRHFDDPRVGLVAPRVCGEQGSPLDLGTQPARIRAGSRVSYVPGAAVVVRRDALDAVGWFDESLRFGEDVDLVWRLDAAGWSCRYEPSSVVWHEPRRTLGARLRQHAAYGSSAAPLALRHPRSLAPFRSNGWTAAAIALAAGGRTASSAALMVGSAAALGRTLPGVPAGEAFRLALTGHLRAVEQAATAVRRAWWPIVGAASIVSRRARWVLAASLVAGRSATPTDVAYGWGVWRGMVHHRTVAPIVPSISSWPPAPGRAGRRPARQPLLRR